MSDNPNPKIGAGHMAAMGRSGFKEISRYLAAFPDNFGVIEEPGVAGNLTPGEIQHSKGFDARAQDASQNSRSQAAAQKETELER